MTKILLIDGATGSEYIKTLNYDLPMYNLGECVGVEVGAPQSGKYDEFTIVGTEFSSYQTKNGEIVTGIQYELDNGEVISEEEIIYRK